MKQTMCATVLVVALWSASALLAAPPPEGAAPVTPPKIDTHYIGFKGNGTGVFPGDCTPVTTWSKDVNVVWKTQLPASLIFGNNSGVIVAGGKVFVLTEPPAQGGMMAPVLYCLDPQDGKVLWQTVCHHVDSLPEAVRAQTLKDLADGNDFFREFDKVAGRYLGLARQLSSSYHYGPKPKTDEEKAKVEADLAKATEDMKALGIKSPGTLMGGKAIKQPGNGDLPYERSQRLVKVGYSGMIDPWIGNGACAVGRACTTPCSDGERIYVTTPFQDLFCLDMDGKILWQQYWGDGKMVGDRANYYPAPILVDGMVIRYRHLGSATTDLLSVRAFDKLTGKLLYTVGAPKTGGAYFIGTPQILTVDGVRLLALSDGRIIRASNGEVLMEETISYSAHGRSDLGFGNWLWTVNGHEGGGYGGDRRQMKNMEIMAHQFSWSDAMKTKLEHKVVWRCDGTGNMIGYYQGLLFHTVGRDTIGTRDAFTGAPKATGKKVSQAGKSGWINAPLCGSDHVFCFANDMIFSPSGGQFWNFASAKDLKLVSLIDKRDMGVAADLNIWGYGEQPFLSGNRLFLRKCHNDPWIYCIGDPKVPTQLSAIHTKPLPPVEK